MQLSLNNLTFTYDGADTPVFENLSVTLDTSWRLGLIGRNGRGKTTLVRLLSGELSCPGVPLLPDSPVFPMPVPDPSLPSMDLMCLLCPGTPVWRLEKEARLMGLDTRLLDQVFSTLSPGEQTRLLLSLLFVREEAYPLIDEPTNHLDRKGREQTAAYLRQKGGFLLVSHDRAFLNACIDHVMSLNRSGHLGTPHAHPERVRAGPGRSAPAGYHASGGKRAQCGELEPENRKGQAPCSALGSRGPG